MQTEAPILCAATGVTGDTGEGKGASAIGLPFDEDVDTAKMGEGLAYGGQCIAEGLEEGGELLHEGPCNCVCLRDADTAPNVPGTQRDNKPQVATIAHWER